MKLLCFIIPLVSSVLGGLRRSKYGCEGTQINLECEDGSYISPVRANYGRFDADICNPGLNKAWSTRCIQPTTLRQVNSLCQGKSSCSIDVTSSVFGDPCPDTYKYLEIHYTCINKVEKPRSQNNNLPPWLLKMSATTSKPSPSSTTSTTPSPGPSSTSTTHSPSTPQTTEKVEPEIEEILNPETFFQNLLDIEEDYEDEMTLEDLLEQERREIFINLPLEEPEIETLKIGDEETVLIATLVSLLSCSLIIFISALLYTKMKNKKKKEIMKREIMISSLDSSKFQDYNTHQNTGHFSVYDYSTGSESSTSSSVYTTIPTTQRSMYTTQGSMYTCIPNTSVYTTLPNGETALVIPLNSNQSYLQHILSNQRLDGQWIGQPSSVSNPTPQQNPENIYIDIDKERY